jgi:MFS family permease
VPGRGRGRDPVRRKPSAADVEPPAGTAGGRAGSPVNAPEHVSTLHAVPPSLPPRPEDARGFAQVLRKRDFRYLWLAQCASQLAQNSIFVILLIVTFALTNKDSITAVVTVAFTLPGVVLSAPAGVFADRHDKRSLMLVTNLARGLILVLAGLATLVPQLAGQAWPLLILTFTFSGAGQLFAPAEAASIPSLVSREQIQGATSLFTTTVIVSIVIGAALGAVAVRLLGNAVPFYIAAALFAVAALLIWRIRASLHAVPRDGAHPTSIAEELREGVGILRRSPALRWGMIQLGLALIVVFTVYALGPDYMDHLLGPGGDQETYIVLVPATVGLMVMAGVLGQHVIRLSRRALMVAAFMVAGACLLAIGTGPPRLESVGASALAVWLVVILALAFGIALGALVIPAFTVLQEGTTEESRGRIFGGVFTVVNLAIAVPALVAGALADWLSVYVAAAAVGGLVVVIGVVFRLRFWSSLETLEAAGTTADGPLPGP